MVELNTLQYFLALPEKKMKNCLVKELSNQKLLLFLWSVNNVNALNNAWLFTVSFSKVILRILNDSLTQCFGYDVFLLLVFCFFIMIYIVP